MLNAVTAAERKDCVCHLFLCDSSQTADEENEFAPSVTKEELHHNYTNCTTHFVFYHFFYILDVAIGVREMNACQSLTLHPAVMQSHHHTGAVLTQTDGVTGSSCFLGKVKRNKGRPAAGLLQTT